jgi:hypothetical protein
MHAVIRTYSGPSGKKVLDFLEEHKKEVEAVVRSVSGIVSYTLLRTADGGSSITVGKDKAASDAMTKAAADWMRQNAAHLGSSPPAVTEGGVIVQIG